MTALKRPLLFLAAGALCLSLTGSELMPAEETFRTAPVIREYAAVEHTLVPCTRGDLVLSRTVSCVYVPVRTEGLTFPLAGLRFDEVYVRAGDYVEKGQLLMQLELGDLEARMDAVSLELEKLLLSREQTEKRRALALRRLEVTDTSVDPDVRKKNAAELNSGYDEAVEDIDDAVSIARLRYADLQDQLKKRQLRSPIDGTVTYVRKIKDGDVTTLGGRVITVVDSTMSLFRAETDLWEMFNPGDSVTITARKKEYEATVVTAEEVGAPVQERTPGTKAYVYFALAEPTFELEDSDRGSLTIVLDAREDVLRVPASAISTINGQTVVYYQREDGMKAYKNVVTGLEAQDMVQIIEGLEEGELVIAD